ADVEQAAVECNGDREPREDEVGRIIERIGEAVSAAERAIHENDGGAQGILTDQQDDEARNRERHDKIDERYQPVVSPSRKLCVGRAHSAASCFSTPAMSRPSSPSVASGVRSPTMRPSNMTR